MTSRGVSEANKQDAAVLGDLAAGRESTATVASDDGKPHDPAGTEYEPVTVEELIDYLQQFDPRTAVFLDSDDAEQEGYDRDYMQESYVSLSCFLDQVEEKKGERVRNSAATDGGRDG